MKKSLSLWMFGAAVLALLTGCAQIETNRIDDPNRVVTGTVTFTEPAVLPSDAKVLVRVLETSPTNGLSKIIAEQPIKGGGASPIAFKIEFRAEDAALRHGLNLEARVDFDGKLQLANGNSYAITSNNLGSSHVIAVEKISR